MSCYLCATVYHGIGGTWDEKNERFADLFEEALDEEDDEKALYRLGIALHFWMDSFAHQDATILPWLLGHALTNLLYGDPDKKSPRRQDPVGSADAPFHAHRRGLTPHCTYLLHTKRAVEVAFRRFEVFFTGPDRYTEYRFLNDKYSVYREAKCYREMRPARHCAASSGSALWQIWRFSSPRSTPARG